MQSAWPSVSNLQRMGSFVGAYCIAVTFGSVYSTERSGDDKSHEARRGPVSGAKIH